MLRRLTLLAATAALAGCTVKTIEAPGYAHAPSYIGDVPGFGEVIRLGDDVTISCSIAGAPAFSVMRCVGGFPYTVPAGKTFCLTHMYLQSKYPWEPPRYGGNMHAVYLQERGVTATSHHPELHFNPPYPFKAGTQLLATISNAQTEPQNVFAFEQGFLVDEGKPCRR